MSLSRRCAAGARTSPPKAATRRAWSLWPSLPTTRGAAGRRDSMGLSEQPASHAAASAAAAAARPALIPSVTAIPLTPAPLVHHCHHIRTGQGQGRALPVLQNPAGPDETAFEPCGAETQIG